MIGWIKLHRKITEWEWYDDVPTRLVFLHLLLTVNYEEGHYQGRKINPGQIVTGRKKLAKSTGLGEQQIRRILNNLQTSQQIGIKTTNKYSVVTILNWELYQEDNQPTNRPEHQPPTTIKETKNLRSKKVVPKNTKAIRSLEELESHLFGKHYTDWFKNRCPDVDIFDTRDSMVRWCRAKGNSYKDYWSALQDWGLRDQKKINGQETEQPRRQAGDW